MIVSLYCEVEESESFIEINEEDRDRLEELVGEYQDSYEENEVEIYYFLKEKGFNFKEVVLERFYI